MDLDDALNAGRRKVEEQQRRETERAEIDAERTRTNEAHLTRLRQAGLEFARRANELAGSVASGHSDITLACESWDPPEYGSGLTPTYISLSVHGDGTVCSCMNAWGNIGSSRLVSVDVATPEFVDSCVARMGEFLAVVESNRSKFTPSSLFS